MRPGVPFVPLALWRGKEGGWEVFRLDTQPQTCPLGLGAAGAGGRGLSSAPVMQATWCFSVAQTALPQKCRPADGAGDSRAPDVSDGGDEGVRSEWGE